MKLSELNIYPIKSLKGISLVSSVTEDRGLQFDRRWMLVDEKGKFLTQREFPVMATLTTEVTSDGVRVVHGDDSITIAPADSQSGREETVQVWSSRVKAAVHGDEVNAFFSDTLEAKVRLVTMTEAKRPVNYWYRVHKEDNVSFADGYPFLLIGQASLDELNARLDPQVPMNRFRPNFVVEGSEPFAEDKWKKIAIGDAVFHIVKPCGRCVITTIDQDAGAKTGVEPLRTLASFRTRRGKVLFGQNLIAENPGVTVRVGDRVEVLETK